VLNIFTPVVEAVWELHTLTAGNGHIHIHVVHKYVNIPLYYSEPVVLLLLHLAKRSFSMHVWARALPILLLLSFL